MIRNLEYQNQQLKKEIEELKSNFKHVDEECTRLEIESELSSGYIKDLIVAEKQIESMRNCGNCGNENVIGGCRLHASVNYTCINSNYKHWKPKETK